VRRYQANQKMNDLDLTSLRIFVAVCEAGNFARVADRENLVPSAVSKRMSKLEVDLGVTLLTKSKRGVEPTAAGRALAERARTLLHDAQKLAEDMQCHRHDATELVQFMSSDSPVAGLLMDDISDFLGQPAHRAIRLKMSIDKDVATLQAIKDGLVQFGVLWDATEMADFQNLPYRGDQLAVVCHRNHPLAQYRQATLTDTLPFQHIYIGSANAVAALLNRAKVIDASKISVRIEVDTFYSAFRLVSAERGICVAPAAAAAKLAELFHLSVIPLTDAWASRRYVIVFQHEADLTPAGRLLVQHLSQAATQAHTSR